jgi:hypothetical protein
VLFRCLDNSLTEIKERVICRAKGKHQVVNVFIEFDTNKSKDLSIGEFIFMLKKVILFRDISLNWNGVRQ